MKNVIQTPFGDINIEHQEISFWIQDSSIKAKRKVIFAGIRAMFEEAQFAEIVWTVWQYEQDQETLKNGLDAVQGRQVITSVSGQNRVTAEGILIIRETFPVGEIGDRAYQMAYSKGINEYIYWMALLRVVPLPVVIQAAGSLLAQYLRFDKP